MKTRIKKKHAPQDSETRTTSEMVIRSLSHLNRSVRQFSEGLQTRVVTLQERLLVEPLESVAWGISQRVRKVQNRVFDFIDDRISKIDEARHRKLDHQTAVERFDGEGGAMLPTTTSEENSDSVESPTPRSGTKPKFAFEPGLSH